MSRSIDAEALDEVDVAETRLNRLPYCSRVGAVQRRFLSTYGPVATLDALITTEPGTAAQRQRINDHYDRIAEDVIDYGTEREQTELTLILLWSTCSTRQLARLAWSWTYWAAVIAA